MANKFDRNYILSVQTNTGKTLTVKRPFTVEFEIHRNSFSSANVASFRIYNLSEDNRSQIRKDPMDSDDLRNMSFTAGYGDNLSLGFAGNISQAWSVREGNNIVTQIESFDGGFAYTNAITDNAFPAGTPQTAVIDSLVASLPGVTKGSIGNYPGSLSKGNAYSGNTTAILTEITGGGFFIDNGKAHCLGDNECVTSEVTLIDAASGLLGTPLLEQQRVLFDVLFEPRLVIGQQLQLKSLTAPNFNGFYKLTGLKHRGTISDAICGDAITSVELISGHNLQTVPNG